MSDTTVTITTKGTHTWLGLATSALSLLLIVVGGLAPTFTRLAEAHPNLIWLQLVSIATGGGMLAAVNASLNKNAQAPASAVYAALSAAASAAAPAIGSVLLSKFIKPPVPVPVSSVAITPVESPAVKP